MNSKNLLKYAVATTGAIALLCATSGRVYALGSIEVTAIDSNYLALSNGQMLPSGDLVELGQFSISDANLSALANGGTFTPATFATLNSDFVPLTGGTSSGTAGSATVSGYAGAMDVTFTGNNSAFAGGPMYLLVYNAATAGAATQVGVFRGPGTAGSGGWSFPSSMATGSSGSDLDTANVSPLIGTYTANSAVDNGWNDNVGNGYPNVNTFNLDRVVSVPEPSSIALVVMGLLGGFGLIRRRRS